MFGIGKSTKNTGASRRSLSALGIAERSAARGHAALLAAGWAEIGYGYHGSVHAHPGHPDVVVRFARKADGFGDYAALLRRGFAGSEGPHAPRIHDLHVSRCGALTTVASRLAEPPRDAWWLPFAHAVIADHPGVAMDDGRAHPLPGGMARPRAARRRSRASTGCGRRSAPPGPATRPMSRRCGTRRRAGSTRTSATSSSAWTAARWSTTRCATTATACGGPPLSRAFDRLGEALREALAGAWRKAPAAA